MRRNRRGAEKSTNMDSPLLALKSQLSNSQFLQKFSKIPVVELSMSTITDYYGKAKASGGLVGTGIGLAESVTVSVTSAVAGRVISTKLNTIAAPPLSKVDDLASKGLEKLENTLPSIKKQPSQIVSDTKQLISTKVSPVVNTYNRASEVVFNTKIAQITFDVFEYVLNTANKTLDVVLPPGEQEKSDAVNGHCEDKGPDQLSARGGWLLRRTYYLATKATKRILGIAQTRVETAAAATDVVLKSAKKAIVRDGKQAST